MSLDATPASPFSPVILVVDDDETVLRMIKAILHHYGFSRILEATNGVQALSLVKELGEAIDLIVTDIQMPQMDGIELVRSMKHTCPHVPVIYISGYPRPDGVIPTDEPFCAFIPKPFQPKTLVDAVRKCLPTPQPVDIAS